MARMKERDDAIKVYFHHPCFCSLCGLGRIPPFTAAERKAHIRARHLREYSVINHRLITQHREKVSNEEEGENGKRL